MQLEEQQRYRSSLTLNGPCLIFICSKSTGFFINIFLATPIGITSILVRFSFSSEQISNDRNLFIAYFNEFIFFRKSVVSSAKRLIVNSVLSNIILSIFWSVLILIAIISATKSKSKAEIGQPCLIDRVSLKYLE